MVPMNCVRDPRLEIRVNSLEVANTAADLNRQIGQRLRNRLDNTGVDRLSCKGAIEIDNMQATGTSAHQRSAIATGSSENTVLSAMSPWRSRTHCPSLRSMAGITSMCRPMRKFLRAAARLMALFRVKLGGKKVAPASSAHSPSARSQSSSDHSRVIGHDVVAVHKIKASAGSMPCHRGWGSAGAPYSSPCGAP